MNASRRLASGGGPEEATGGREPRESLETYQKVEPLPPHPQEPNPSTAKVVLSVPRIACCFLPATRSLLGFRAYVAVELLARPSRPPTTSAKNAVSIHGEHQPSAIALPLQLGECDTCDGGEKKLAARSLCFPLRLVRVSPPLSLSLFESARLLTPVRFRPVPFIFIFVFARFFAILDLPILIQYTPACIDAVSALNGVALRGLPWS
jgi:hypothetical protein